MKHFLIALIIAVTGLALFLLFSYQKKESAEQKIEEDYLKIEQVEAACRKAASAGYGSTLGSNQGKWYIFELEFIHHKDNGIYAELEEMLGEDFETSLSNGDSLFVGFLPCYRSYRVYAGYPGESGMLYPDWNYDALPTEAT